MTSTKGNGVVHFEFYRRDARDVRLVGDFTGWEDRPLAMQDAGDGWWRLAARFDQGEYRFCYRADGQSFPDYAAHGIEMTDYGIHSVLVVSEHPQATGTPADAIQAA